MANTTNLNLVKLSGSEKLKTYPTNQAGNMDTIDAAFGAGFGLSGNPSVNTSINNLADGLAIVANGNTHAAITSGQFVYVRNHGSLSEGLYTATSNISANGTLSGSNLTADAAGGLNVLNGKLSNYAFGTPFNLTTDNQNNYTTPMVTTVYDQVNSMGWCTFIVAGKAEGSHLSQLLINENGHAIRSNESGTWSAWDVKKITTFKSFSVTGTTTSQGLLSMASVIPYPYIPVYVLYGTGNVVTIFNGSTGNWQPYLRITDYNGNPVANATLTLTVLCLYGSF